MTSKYTKVGMLFYTQGYVIIVDNNYLCVLSM